MTLRTRCRLTHIFNCPAPAPFVMGYANRLSCVLGEEIAFLISASGNSVSMVCERLGAERVKVLENDA